MLYYICIHTCPAKAIHLKARRSEFSDKLVVNILYFICETTLTRSLTFCWRDILKVMSLVGSTAWFLEEMLIELDILAYLKYT